ncbi:MAG: LysR family transcriptional regulator [Deltaproteobacteria bacterium]|jgi:DNA-binding transcriptional LysR family regulator|nr:LysR family transcriptional regulator [Deltaproteobacteria bacterium]
MEWQQIVGFYNVVKLQSFTRAAEATARSQSALSQQIKALEEEFECRLIERAGKRGLRLTIEGEIFLNFAERALRGSEDFRESLETIRKNKRGRLRIAAPFTTLYHLLPEALKQYMSRFPRVELTLLDRPQSMVIDLVRSGDVDLGLTLEKEAPVGLATVRWKQVETVVIVPPDHPLCALKRVSLRQLAKYPLILPPKHLQHAGRMLLEEQFRKMGIDYRVIMESSNVELSSAYVELGLGVSCASIVRGLPQLAARKLSFLSLGHLFKPEFIVLAMRKDKAPAAHMQAFMQLLLQTAK